MVVKIAADHGDNGASKVKSYQRRRKRKKSINLAIVSANNHYAGFGPGTAIYSERWSACQKPYGVRMRIRTRMRLMAILLLDIQANNHLLHTPSNMQLSKISQISNIIRSNANQE